MQTNDTWQLPKHSLTVGTALILCLKRKRNMVVCVGERKVKDTGRSSAMSGMQRRTASGDNSRRAVASKRSR